MSGTQRLGVETPRALVVFNESGTPSRECCLTFCNFIHGQRKTDAVCVSVCMEVFEGV